MEEKEEELDMDCITDSLHIDGIESHINTVDDELQVGEFTIRSPQDLNVHLVTTDIKGVDFGVLICLYNILTRIQQSIKVEETLAEVVKHKKYLAILNIYEDEAITVYAFSIVKPGLFGDKCSTKKDIGPLPD